MSIKEFPGLFVMTSYVNNLSVPCKPRNYLICDDITRNDSCYCRAMLSRLLFIRVSRKTLIPLYKQPQQIRYHHHLYIIHSLTLTHRHLIVEGRLQRGQAQQYYFLTHLFSRTVRLTCTCGNLNAAGNITIEWNPCMKITGLCTENDRLEDLMANGPHLRA